MKIYQKPTLEVVQLRVKENLAKTTIYESMALNESPTLDNTELSDEGSVF